MQQGITEKQINIIVKVFSTKIQKAIDRIRYRVNRFIGFEDAIQLILYMFRSRYSRQMVLKLAVCVINNNITDKSINIVCDVLHGKNLLGFNLRQNNLTGQLSYVENTRKISRVREQKIYYLLLHKLLTQQCNAFIDSILLRQQKVINANIIRYTIIQFPQYTQNMQLLAKQCFNKNCIGAFYEKYKSDNNITFRKQSIIKIYEKYIQDECDDMDVKYNSYQFIQYLVTISNDKFRDEFQVNDNADVEMLVKFVKEYIVKNICEFKIKASIVKHVEWSQIYIWFSDQFKVEDVPDETIVNMLDNIENGLKRIEGPYNYNFIIIHRVSDNMIVKKMIDENGENQQQIEEILQQCSNSELYDIIIYSEYKYESLNDLRIRYLNYYNEYWHMEISLKHPKHLISVSLCQVKITNMNECINLRNLFSRNNVHKRQNISSLRNMKRIYSLYNLYHSNAGCFLNDLCQSSKLEYVYIQSIYANSNVLSSITLSKNTENMRFIEIHQRDALHDIKLEISGQISNLAVFSVKTEDRMAILHGRLQGKSAMVSKTEEDLIHQLQKRAE